VPAAFLGHTGNDLAVRVLVLAYHQRWFEVSIILEMSYGGEKMLMPSTQEYLSTESKIVHPFLFIFNRHYE
jgi:hypothetical protein